MSQAQQGSSADSTASPTSNILVLASGSPRRRELLTRAGVAFEVRPANIPEIQRPGETPVGFATRLAREKALAVARIIGSPPRPVLGADTIVVIDDRILGKPRDVEHAVELLSLLVGRRHAVITAVAIVNSETLAVHETVALSQVVMRHAERDELVDYAASGEPLDKAGGYALQGEGRRFVVRVEGSETNVIGLPVEETLALLKEGWTAPAVAAEVPVENA